MKTIVFNNKEYGIPQNWGEVTVGMLIKASELSELLEDAPLIAIISAYTGIPVKEIRLNNREAVQEIIDIMEFLSTPYAPTDKTEFEFKGENYSCSRKLTEQNFEDWVSIQTAIYNNRNEPTRALPRMIAIMCKRDKETLDDFDLNERSKLFEELPMTIAKDVECFFLLSLHESNACIQLSSIINTQKDLVQAKVQELENTLKTHKGRSGLFSGMRFQIGIWQLQLWWVKSRLQKYFNSEHFKQ